MHLQLWYAALPMPQGQSVQANDHLLSATLTIIFVPVHFRTHSESETTVSNSETVVSDSETAVSESETAVSDSETAVSDSKTAVSEPETAVLDPIFVLSYPSAPR